VDVYNPAKTDVQNIVHGWVRLLQFVYKK